MDHMWKTVVGFLSLEFLELCSSHPVPYYHEALEAEVPGALLGMALLLVSVVCLVACVCCRESQRKGFKEFRDSTHSLTHTGLSFTNPGLSPGSELAIFPPPGVTSLPSVTFDPLPSTVHITRRPTAYRNVAVDNLSDADWFGDVDLDFPRQQLQYLRECGRGWFGRVVEGEAQGLSETRHKVMVRILREDATTAEQKFFLNEAKPYRDLNHKNVLKMVGRCLETNPYLILLEACSGGDLKSFLCSKVTSSQVLSEQGMCLRVMCQVAAGLQHMISHGFVHTDLAARNCLVTWMSGDLTVKVGDYGTSIETYKSDYYIAGDVAVPVRWCAPETLHCTPTTIETKQVTAEANVWSLGVVLWEICQFGQMPYSELTDDQVIVKVLGADGLRLPPPTLHTRHASALHSLMSQCWLSPESRASLDHVLSMLNHLQASHSEEDFQRRWDALRPNTSPEINLETMTARSDFDSGVDLEIKSADHEVLSLVKKSSSDINLTPSSASPQLSVTSSSGGEFFSQTNLSVLKKQQSPSLTNLRGSVEDITKPSEEEISTNPNKTEEFESWLKGVETANEEDVKFVKKISEAIKDLDDALALEKTSSEDDSSRQESPLRDANAQEENPVLDFRLGPLNEVRKQVNIPPLSLLDDSSIRRDSSGTDTEDETWRKRIERGEFSEKVKEKSKSVTDLMILTHIESESSESDSLPSLTRQYSVEKTKRRPSGTMMSTIGFGSEGNIRGAVLGEEFQDALKQLQAEWKVREMESRESSLQFMKSDADTSQQEKLDFLSNDASEKLKTQHVTMIESEEQEQPLPISCSSPIIHSSVVNESFQKSALPSRDCVKEQFLKYTTPSDQTIVSNHTVSKMEVNQSSSSMSLRLSPEITDSSETSQNTESSSEISTPTQYEVLEHLQMFINSEAEHTALLNHLQHIHPPSNNFEITGLAQSKLDTKETLEIVQKVPNPNTVNSNLSIDTKDSKPNCDITYNFEDSIKTVDNEQLFGGSAEKPLINEFSESTFDALKLGKCLGLQSPNNDMLINSATQKESETQSDIAAAVSSQIAEISKPISFDSSVEDIGSCYAVPPEITNFLQINSSQNNENQVPKIVVTEASILDIDSDSEPELDLTNTNKFKRSIKIVLSSTDDETDNEERKSIDGFNESDSLIDSYGGMATSTPFVRARNSSFSDGTVSEVDPTFPEASQSESFFVPVTKENKPEMTCNESSVILGSCEDYTLDYFKGLKTTFGKQPSDESADEFSKSEGEDDEKKQTSVTKWDEFLTNALEERYQETPLNFDLEFEPSDNDLELNDKNRGDETANLNNLSDKDIDVLNSRTDFSENLSESLRKNMIICDRMDMFENFNGKQSCEDQDQQMQEVKSRLEDVALLSEGFCLKNQMTSMDDDEDGKLLTPDDERSSDSGFRDKGSLSESVEDACDEKYNLEDIEAELDEQYIKQLDSTTTEDNQNIDEDDKTHTKEDLDATVLTTIKRSGSSVESSEEAHERQERLNELDNSLDANIDVYFENSSQPKTGWYLHPRPGSQQVTSGWLSTSPEEGKESFEIDEEFVTAIRNELKEKLPCAQNPERADMEEDLSPEETEEEERADIVIQYNTYPAPLSPIFEDRESVSSNHSSLLVDDMGRSLESSRSSPVMFLDVTNENGHLSNFEDDIRSALDVCSSESTESDNILVTVEDLENSRESKAQKVVENTKDDMDDLLIVDIETNKVTLLESPRPRSQLAFVKQIVEPVNDNVSIDSDVCTFDQSADDHLLSVDRHNHTFTPDSSSPLSTESSRTGAAVSFSSSETVGSLSEFFLSPSSVRSDLLDSGPQSLPFELGQTYEPVQVIFPNNEAEEIMQELVETGVLKDADLTDENEIFSRTVNCGLINGKESSKNTSERIQSEQTDDQTETTGSSLDSPGSRSDNNASVSLGDNPTEVKCSCNTTALQIFTPKNVIVSNCDRIDKIICSEAKEVQPVEDHQLELKVTDSQDWLKSVLLSNTHSQPKPDQTKLEGTIVCLNSSDWPRADELITQPLPQVTASTLAQPLPQVTASTPESPCLDLLEVAAKFYDVNSTLAISTPNNISFDESKDNSQLSSFTSTPTLETKCITAVTKPPLSNHKTASSVPPLSSLACEIVMKLPASELEKHMPASPGLTLALEPNALTKAPMPSPEDADKGLWRPTIGQLMELSNQPDQEDMMTTSFIDADNNDYAPDWESDSSSDSEEHSSSSGEFIWRPQEGVSEMSMARISEEEDEDEEDNSSCGSTTEFIPSSWDSNATPTKSALKSAEKPTSEKRNVCFKRQKYHCVYEYPREPSDSEDEEEPSILQRRTWQSPSTFDYSTYADWEYGEGEVEAGGESDSDDASPRQIPESEYDFYRLSNLDFEMMTQMNLDEGEFFISSSARPFQMGDSSQFFPGSISDDDFLVEFQPCASDTNELVLSSTQQLRLDPDDTISGRLQEVSKSDGATEKQEKQKPTDLFIAADLPESTSSAEVSPTLGELRHTRQKLKLDLGHKGGGAVKSERGEASLLDSGGEDSGVESTATGSSDRLDQVQASEA